MENKFHELPPLKRYRLMQQDPEPKHQDPRVASLSCLPAKKRKQSRASPPPPTPTATALCLPAKKRVWAPHPDLLPEEPVCPFDLNVEYKPTFDDEEEEKNVSIPADLADKVPISNSVEDAEEYEEEEEEKNVSIAESINGGEENEEGDVDEEEEEVNAQEAENVPILNNIEEIEERQEEEEEEKNVSIAESIEGREENEAGEGDVDVDDGIECAVCQSTDGDPSDPIVFCDGCDLMVHSTCYGSPLTKGIPEGDWFCAQCLVSQSPQTGNGNADSFSCCLCPVTGGAMKPTNDGRWAHIVCAVFVPEVFFTDPEGREGIDFSRVPDKRWGQSCYVCVSGRGCAIDCSELKCPLAFHVGCGLKEELCIEYREGKNKGAVVAGFCKKHTELWKKQQETGKFKIVARE